MTSLMEESTVATGPAWGDQSMVAPLSRVLVRKPAPPATEDEFSRFGYPRAVDHDRTQIEHGGVPRAPCRKRCGRRHRRSGRFRWA